MAANEQFTPHWFGDYELLQPLGHGGMAEVFLARFKGAMGFEKVAVVKRMLAPLVKRPDLVKMFVGEAKLAVQLQHANIVQILSLEEVEGRPFIVMEYVHGRDLHHVLRRSQDLGAPLPVDFGLHCIVEMLRGLHYAHQANGPDGKPLNLVHRDVTPSNIFISFDGEVKLGDFGVAHATGEEAGHGMRGKLSYMAPEVVQGQAVDARADLFSAGVVLWETLAQRRLFVGKSSVEILGRIGSLDPPPPSKFNSRVAPDLDLIAARALHKDREQRFQSAVEFEEALSDFLFARRLRWTRQRIADVMRAHFGEESKPLVLTASPPQERLHTPLSTNVADITTQRLARELRGASVIPVTPIGMDDENPWSDSIESHIVHMHDSEETISSLEGLRLHEHQLRIQLLTQPDVVEMSFIDTLALLRDNPQQVRTLGVVGDRHISRQRFGALTYWDSLLGYHEPQMPPVVETSLRVVSPCRLLYEATVRRMSGLIVLEDGDGRQQRMLFLDQGYPVYVHSNAPDDGVLAIAHAHTLIEPNLLYQAVCRVADEGVALDQAMAVLVPEAGDRYERLFSAMVRSRLIASFGWERGRFRVFSQAQAPTRLQTRMPPLLGLLIRATLREMPLALLETYLSPHAGRALQLSGSRRDHVSALRLRPVEARVADAVDGSRSFEAILETVAPTSAEEHHACLGALYVLLETGVVRQV
ncbi:MAG: serine/threonine-protein kinase [Pseudomonadota bacterium]